MSSTYHTSPVNRVLSESEQISQDTTLDMLAKGDGGKVASHSVPMSLKPDDRVSIGCALGNGNCKAIRDAWRFNQPITVMAADEFDALVERCGNLVFVGLEKDIDDSASIEAQEELEAEFNG